MAKFRNDLGEDRVVPTLGYTLVAAGAEFTVPDDQAEHYVAGGFTAVDTPPPAAPAKTAPTAVKATEGTDGA